MLRMTVTSAMIFLTPQNFQLCSSAAFPLLWATVMPSKKNQVKSKKKEFNISFTF
jgi:hypothetical protein